MIKDEYLKESTIPDDQDLVSRKKKFRRSYFNFADFDERKMLRALRLGLYFRQSLIGMVKYREHGDNLFDDND